MDDAIFRTSGGAALEQLWRSQGVVYCFLQQLRMRELEVKPTSSCSHWMVLEMPIKKELRQEFHRNCKNKRDYLISCYLEKPVSKTTKSMKTRKWNQKVARIDAIKKEGKLFHRFPGIYLWFWHTLKKALIMLNAILTINKHLCNFNCCISLEYTENLCSFCVVRNQHI